MNVTSIADLQRYGSGSLVELPPFAEDQPFFAKIKRPSLLALVKQGRIPNKLLSTANELFVGSTHSAADTGNPEAMKDIFDVMDTICSACFIEPSYEEMKAANVELTDEQLMFIFNYSQHGVKALDSFRRFKKDPIPVINVENVQQDPVGAVED